MTPFRVMEVAPRVPSVQDVRDAIAEAMEKMFAEYGLCGRDARKAFLMTASEQAGAMGREI